MDASDSAAKRILERAPGNVGDKEERAERLGVHIADLNRSIFGKRMPP
jgi:hypothetical protein